MHSDSIFGDGNLHLATSVLTRVCGWVLLSLRNHVYEIRLQVLNRQTFISISSQSLVVHPQQDKSTEYTQAHPIIYTRSPVSAFFSNCSMDRKFTLLKYFSRCRRVFSSGHAVAPLICHSSPSANASSSLSLSSLCSSSAILMSLSGRWLLEKGRPGTDHSARQSRTGASKVFTVKSLQKLRCFVIGAPFSSHVGDWFL
jgi:hypothetical protein